MKPNTEPRLTVPPTEVVFWVAHQNTGRVAHALTEACASRLERNLLRMRVSAKRVAESRLSVCNETLDAGTTASGEALLVAEHARSKRCKRCLRLLADSDTLRLSAKIAAEAFEAMRR